ncbi:MAG: hypothetical protein LKG31_01750 [Lactobacillus sp.]|nr:hypothetical protein [Lactobacillus sp.]
MQNNTKDKQVYKQTARKFFKSDFKRLLAFSGRQATDLMPDNLKNLHPLDIDENSSGNSDMIYASKETACICKAIADCTNLPRQPFREILIKCYLQDGLNYQISNSIGYGQSQYQCLKKQAIREFSARYVYYQLLDGLQPLICLK